MPLVIRPESTEDPAAIEAVTTAAFRNAEHTSHTEQFIVAALRRAGQLTVSLVAEDNYYGRFGFRADPSLALPGVPPEYFQALAFRGVVPAGTVAYHRAFDATS